MDERRYAETLCHAAELVSWQWRLIQRLEAELAALRQSKTREDER